MSNGQDSSRFFFDEYSFSANLSDVTNDNTNDRYGFGLGAYHAFLSEKKFNIILGFEYNRTCQFKKYMYEGHFAHATDLTYSLNCLSIPIGLRFNIGSGVIFFFETGGFADLVISSYRKGIMHTCLPDENNVISCTSKAIEEKAGLSSSVGIFLGLGARIPILKFELVIKPDYKFGVNKIYSYQDDIFNRYLRLNIGIKIR
jgi:hypothetical protein